MFRRTLFVLIAVTSFLCLVSCSDSVSGKSSNNSPEIDSIEVDGPVSFVPGILDSAASLPEGPGEVFACRYWPGELTLNDGTVVQSADKFYVKKSDTFQNCYILYYPAIITDVYEAGGGGFSGSRNIPDTAFLWYMRKYYPSINVDGYPSNITNVRAFCDSILSKSVVEPSPKKVNYEGTRETAYSDASKYSSVLPNLKYSCLNYNSNDLKDEKGNPITNDELYFQISGDYVIVRYPMIISDIYEMVTKDFSTGSEYWTYVYLYYPELRNEQNTKVIIETLAGNFIEPKVEDYIEYFNF